MKIIISPTYSPEFNIASEEYLIKNFKEDIFLLYINNPTIIIGKHQNTLAEIDINYVKEQNISIVRRLSGGGAVYHDRGNLNFSFITNINKERTIDFFKHTLPIINSLKSLNVDAHFEGRNDLTIDGKKFSGNASHIYKNRICHHGTILFNSDLNVLSKSLKPDSKKFEGKSIKSVQSRVTNIIDHLQKPISIVELRSIIINYVKSEYPDSNNYSLSNLDIDIINQLVENKYNTWEWNFGKSPEYNFTKSIKTPAGNIQSYLFVENGIIKSVHFFGDYFETCQDEYMINKIRGIRHDKNELSHVLSQYDINKYFVGFSMEDILNVLI